MPIHSEIRRLQKTWSSNTGWPKRLEWLEINGLRGWTGQRIEFKFPIMAIVGENGAGKSTIIQAAASVYRGGKKTKFASDYFMETVWDKISGITIKYGYKEGAQNKDDNSLRRPTNRWLGNTDRPERPVEYIDLSRVQPVSAKAGYARIAKTKHEEKSSEDFEPTRVKRLSNVLGRLYDAAKMALTTIDDIRKVPVLSKQGVTYSGYNSGAGETTITEFLKADFPKYGLILIDEIESSLHPRAQRRLIRELAEICRERELQIILTTHSPIILEELPLEARLYVMETANSRQVISSVSPQFAMTKMDDETYPECDLYVEDRAAAAMLSEILAFHAKNLFPRCQIIPYGAASVGQALGQMVDKFPRPSCVYLDGDMRSEPGCILLPGNDAPERVVFEALADRSWLDLWVRIGRDMSSVMDECTRAMTLSDHHEWITAAANALRCSGVILWQAMCAEWAQRILKTEDARIVFQPIEDKLSSVIV
jgi:predicted ATPase